MFESYPSFKFFYEKDNSNAADYIIFRILLKYCEFTGKKVEIWYNVNRHFYPPEWACTFRNCAAIMEYTGKS